MPLTVSAAATAVGVEAHVLRHWEDVGVLTPTRTAAGHRRYDDELVARGPPVRLCQRAGLSLADIRDLSAADREARIDLINVRLVRIRANVAELRRADAFLGHVVGCVHPMVSECPDCARFSSDADRDQVPV